MTTQVHNDYFLPRKSRPVLAFSQIHIGTLVSIIESKSPWACNYRLLNELFLLDPVLSALIIREANAFDHIEEPIISTGTAINELGKERLLSFIMDCYDVQTKLPPCPAFDYQRFWTDSITLGIISANLASNSREFSTQHYSAIYTISTMLRIGLLQLVLQHPAEMNEILQLPEESLLEAEQQSLGTDHYQEGEKLFSNWDLPDSFIAPVRFKRDTGYSMQYKNLVSIIRVANQLIDSHFDPDSIGQSSLLFNYDAVKHAKLVYFSEIDWIQNYAAIYMANLQSLGGYIDKK